ncbi:MAG: hypothetical protein AAB443_02670 [Patescibacteria group bacterium]
MRKFLGLNNPSQELFGLEVEEGNAHYLPSSLVPKEGELVFVWTNCTAPYNWEYYVLLQSGVPVAIVEVTESHRYGTCKLLWLEEDFVPGAVMKTLDLVLKGPQFLPGFICGGGGFLVRNYEPEVLGFLTLEGAKAAAEQFCTGMWALAHPAVVRQGSSCLDPYWVRYGDDWSESQHSPCWPH